MFERVLSMASRAPDQWVGAVLRPNRLIAADELRLAPAFITRIRELVGINGGKVSFLPDHHVVLLLRKDGDTGAGQTEREIRLACRTHATEWVDARPEPDPTRLGLTPAFYDVADGLGQFDQVLQMVARLQTAHAPHAQTRAGTTQAFGLDARALGEIESVLPHLDVVPLLQHQSICALVGERPPIPVFRETYVSIEKLRALVLPQIDLRRNRPLFASLTRALDPLVIGALTGGRLEPAGPIGLNLATTTASSPAFDALLGHARARSLRLVIELQAQDVLADHAAFRDIVRRLRDEGHKSCLDGLFFDTAALLNLERLEVDLIKLTAERDRCDDKAPGLEQYAADIQRAGVTRVIMTRCSTAAEVAAGQAAGIRLFQGWHVDDLMARVAAPSRVAARVN